MRVAHFTDTPRSGGAERVLEDIVGACVRAGHDVTVLAPQLWLLEGLVTAIPEAAVHAVPNDDYASASGTVRRARAMAAHAPRVVEVLRRLSPDVLHVHNGGYPGSDLCRLAMLASSVARVPRRLLTVHAAPRRRDESHVALQTVIDWAVWRASHTVIGATDAVGERLHELRGMPDDGCWVRIPYGVPEPGGGAGAAALRAQLGVDADELLVGMIAATDDEQKGHHVLVEALGLCPAVRAVVVGAQLPAAVSARAAQLGLGGRLLEIGRLDEIGPVFHAIDVLVVPSVSDESLPLVVLEAMASCKPVVASRLAGIPEAVLDGVTGSLFEPGDAGALSRALVYLADDRPRGRAFGQAGHERWSTQYSVETMTRATLALYAGT
jgi:glycosyltransferase involved in cell wall biosynthesis